MNTQKWCIFYKHSGIKRGREIRIRTDTGNLQTNEETEPIDEQEINKFTRCEKQFQETNNTNESNDDTHVESEEQRKRLLNEDKGDRQVEDERDDEAAEVERDYQDQEEEQDDEVEDTQSVKTYVKNTILFDDDERNPHATSSPKGNIQLCFIFLSHVMLASMKYNPFYLCRLHIFAN